MKNIIVLILLYLAINLHSFDASEHCQSESDCVQNKNRYNQEINEWTKIINKNVEQAINKYTPCESSNCKCHEDVMNQDLSAFKDGISKEQFDIAVTKGTKYQIIDGQVYRQKDCHFPARCAGVEHYLVALAPKLPNMELAINTRDWPQVNQAWGHQRAPVFSFSKTKDYYDIMYPAWSFWEGGPAISLYPTGIGRWDKHRLSISEAAEKWPWSEKKSQAFFRGSRTNGERDALILLSRSRPELVDAQFTKNQAWKSDADTLYASPASEVSFEEHCKYKYLFNYRGVAASFRFKHLFLCKSLVFHVGNDWLEFFYPSLKPWVHYVPISPKANQDEIIKYIEYFQQNDSLAKEIADRGFQQIWDNLTVKDVKCYWRKLLKGYAKLVKYEVKKDTNLIKV
ncbi:PREDICTED: O-glucosyltransferase rumi homolog [Papilio polytes]|uniref:O-glucosyltransferase rumi homolog n=1 Tax=Papilio polytes TaxID=76194 RepID=UPI000676A97B|nr:PREDICTED: O-glucosyltransferase rumi homolog [Papilio polytes]